MLKKVIITILISLSSLSAYHTVDINMNSDELETGVHLDLAQFSNSFSINRYFVGLDYLYVESEEDSSDETDYLLSLDFMMKNRLAKVSAITFGLGAKILSTKVGERDVVAIPLGIYMNFALPINSLPISLSAQFYYSPKPLTFNDGDKYFEQRYELIFEVIKMGEIFIGYRDLSVEESLNLGGENLDISKLPYIGLRFGF